MNSQRLYRKFSMMCMLPSRANMILHRKNIMYLYRSLSSSPHSKATAIDKIRNIGIMAHIDAGKTTTTERMLYLSGFTRHLGDVDRGDTVTDYMEQERERGITIQSAAVTFFWNQHQVNLIDTPGHVDFTAEVERSLRVLDGAIAVLDASAGVEAQTLTVWRQADTYKIPRLIFLNKMDKNGANFNMCIQSIKEKLNVQPLPICLPIGNDKTFSGIVDLINLEQLTWDVGDSKAGIKFNIDQLSQLGKTSVHETVLQGRAELIGQLADLDDQVADYVLSDTKLEDIPIDVIKQALRRVTIAGKAVPVLTGSAKKNVAIQPLIDAVISYLPCPVDIDYDFLKYYENELCALAFKTVHDKHRGALTFIRLYSGVLKEGQDMYNVNQKLKEKLHTADIYQVNADEYKPLKEISAGNIVCIAGLDHTKTGDTLTSRSMVARKAAKKYRELHHIDSHTVSMGTEEKEHEDEDEEGAVLAGIEIPPPVFFCAIEAPSSSKQVEMEEALVRLQREDPSLKVEFNPDTGQTILSGMGELHLEIIKNRLETEYGLETYYGPLQISYQESLVSPIEHRFHMDRVIGKQNNSVTIGLNITPSETFATPTRKNTTLSAELSHVTYIQRVAAIQRGTQTALMYGPLYHAPVMNAKVHVTELEIARGTTLPFIQSAVSQAVREAMAKGELSLLEPIMYLEIQTDEANMKNASDDLFKRRGEVLSTVEKSQLYVLTATAPLAELVGYATSLRILTHGRASFTMELSHYSRLLPHDQENVLNKRYSF